MDDPNTAGVIEHQITDDQGQIVADGTAEEEAAPQEQTPVDESATAEKSEGEETSPKEETELENESTGEPEMVPTAEDETGKRYVPEARFKEVYAKWKDADRRARIVGTTPPIEPKRTGPINKQDSLEIELLRSTLPQFNPEHPEYSRDVDEMGFSIYEGSKNPKGEYSMTRIEAGRRALSMAKRITSRVAEIKNEARSVKAQQSDQGITNRVLNREGAQLDPNKMTLEEKEEWLKANDLW